MTLFLDTHHYKTLGTAERRQDLFSRPGNLRLKEAGNAEARVARFNLEAFMIGEVSSTGHEVDVCEPVGVSLIVPIFGRMVSSTTNTTIHASVGEALLFSPIRRNTRVEMLGNRKFLGVPVIISADELSKTAEKLGIMGREMRDIGEYSVKLSAAKSRPSQELIQLVNVLYSEISRAAPGLTGMARKKAWAQLLKEKLVEVLNDTGVLAGRYETNLSAASRNVRRAQDFMHAHYSTITGVAEIANTCGLSIRSLQDSFRTVWSITPHEMLQAIRLDAARKRLVKAAGDERVTEVALACGFTHLGRFSTAYRERFGERPSETRRGVSGGP